MSFKSRFRNSMIVRDSRADASSARVRTALSVIASAWASSSSTACSNAAGSAGRSGGAPEAVIEGETGMVVDGDSARQVAAALAALLRMSPERRREMGARGRALTLARHTPGVVGERYHELLRRAAGR